MSDNQIRTLWGKSHETWIDELEKAVERREKRTLLAKASRSIRRAIRLRKKEIIKLSKLKDLLAWRAAAMDGYGVDAKKAKHILKLQK